MKSLVSAAAALALTATLGACASSPAGQANLRPSLAPEVDEGGLRSPYGLFLAGQAAIGQGSSREAAAFFGKASDAAPGTPDLRTRAFSAALLAGDMSKAAAAAPGPGEGTPASRSLGRLVQAVDDLADGRAKPAAAALSGPEPIASPHDIAADLLRPWALYAAGDQTAALAKPAASRSAGLDAYATLERAQLLERAGRLAEAEQVYKTDLADKTGLFALAHGLFLERRGRRTEAVAVYDAALAKQPRDPAFRIAGLAPPPGALRPRCRAFAKPPPRR